MSNQHELVDRVLAAFHKAGILEHLIIVGSWCIYFYRHRYKEAEALPPLRTLDMDIDVNFLSRTPVAVNIPKLLEELGFHSTFHGDGSMEFLRPELAIEFLIPEKGRSAEGPCKIPGFGVVAQPLRFLSLLEDEVITVPYRGLNVHIPHPVRFAIHKLIISQRRRGLNQKAERDIRQAVEVLGMVYKIGEQQKIKGTLEGLTRKQKRYVKQSLGTKFAAELAELAAPDVLGFLE